MEYSDRNSGKQISIKPIGNNVQEKYLKLAGIASFDDITPRLLKKVVKPVIDDYLSGCLSLDDLSSLFSIVYEKTIYKNEFHEHNWILELGADLSYFERNCYKSETAGVDFGRKLSEIVKFVV